MGTFDRRGRWEVRGFETDSFLFCPIRSAFLLVVPTIVLPPPSSCMLGGPARLGLVLGLYQQVLVSGSAAQYLLLTSI